MSFEWVRQIIGCAYTYQGSLGMRKALTRNLQAHHSSQSRDFSYFYKGDKSTVVGHGQDLVLTKHPITGLPVKHWPEPELAMVLGRNHEAKGYCLANDFTAFELEVMGRTKDFDGTFFGKCWARSCSLGPRIVPAGELDTGNLGIGLQIERNGEVVYRHEFSTKMRKREFNELPGLIIEYRKQRDNVQVPPSKEIAVDKHGFLPEGTVLLTGAGLIVPPKCYSKVNDAIAVYSPQIGELKNLVKGASPV